VDSGHTGGGKESILPLGRFESATEMPALWYLAVLGASLKWCR
jgi:hypothetical protein